MFEILLLSCCKNVCNVALVAVIQKLFSSPGTYQLANMVYKFDQFDLCANQSRIFQQGHRSILALDVTVRSTSKCPSESS